MVSLIGLLSIFSSLFLSTVASVASPQSIGSDLAIITHNDLYGNATTRRAASIVLSTPYTYSTAASKCAALGTILWNPDNLSQEPEYLRYLDYGKVTDHVGLYWVKGNSTLDCRAITTHGELRRYPCDTQLPALCSNTGVDNTRQVAITTNNATIIGRREISSSSFHFLGIKYASISARFSHSTYLPPTSESNISALEYAPRCIQQGCQSSGQAACSEDCLSLNIWTPYLPNSKVAAGKRKAVMVWIHGGGFTSGTASDTTFDGSAMASRGDVVLVTINYRLSTLGFLALANTSLTGNYGLRDQLTALDWLHAHIEDFGGDKDRITVFGQSAGAASVRALLASPQAQEKVSGAIMMSTPQGLEYASTFSRYLPIAEAINRTEAIIAEVGCAQVDDEKLVACLRNVNPIELVGFRNASQSFAGTVARYPVVDGMFLTSDALPLGPSAPKLNITIMGGIMRDDGSAFTSYPTTTNVSQVLTAQGFPAADILSSHAFPIPDNINTTLAIFNLTSRVATDAMFRCLAQSTAYTASANSIFKSVYAYEFDRAYQISDWSPNPPACEAPLYKCHSGDLYSVFGTTLQQGKQPRNQDDIPFSQYILDTWTSFARTENPNPERRFLEARGFVNTTRMVEKAGYWAPLGKGEERVRVLDIPVREEGFREREQCDVLGMPSDYYNSA